MSGKLNLHGQLRMHLPRKRLGMDFALGVLHLKF